MLQGVEFEPNTMLEQDQLLTNSLLVGTTL